MQKYPSSFIFLLLVSSVQHIGALFSVPDSYTASTLEDSVQSPVILTTSNGVQLELVKYHSHSASDGPLVLTEMELSFYNTEERTIEGRFQLVLPDGAVVTRWAMEVFGNVMEGEVLERKRAREIFESYLQTQRDPALLEKSLGNVFTARVFPIFGRQIKKIYLTHTWVMDRQFTLPIKSLPSVDDFRLRVVISRRSLGSSKEEVVERDITKQPNEDVVIPFDVWGSEGAFASDKAVLQFSTQPFFEQLSSHVSGNTNETITEVVFLLDSSASMDLQFERAVEATIALMMGLPEDVKVSLATFDFDTETYLESGYVSDLNMDTLQSELLDRGCFGASSFQRALEWLCPSHSHEGVRAVVVTDGMQTIQMDLDIAAVVDNTCTVARLDVVAIGGIRDTDVMDELVGAMGAVPDVDAADTLQDVVEILNSDLLTVDVTVEGALWSWPQTFHVTNDDRITVFAEYLEGVDYVEDVKVCLSSDDKVETSISQAVVTQIVESKLGTGAASNSTEPNLELVEGAVDPDEPIDWLEETSASSGLCVTGTLPLHQTPHPLLDTHISARKTELLIDFIDEIERQSDDDTMVTQLESSVVKLSLEKRLVNRYTSFLVLESEEEYARFGIDTNQLPDMLRIDGGGDIVYSQRKLNSTKIDLSEWREGDADQESTATDTFTVTGTTQETRVRSHSTKPLPHFLLNLVAVVGTTLLVSGDIGRSKLLLVVFVMAFCCCQAVVANDERRLSISEMDTISIIREGNSHVEAALEHDGAGDMLTDLRKAVRLYSSLLDLYPGDDEILRIVSTLMTSALSAARSKDIVTDETSSSEFLVAVNTAIKEGLLRSIDKIERAHAFRDLGWAMLADGYVATAHTYFEAAYEIEQIDTLVADLQTTESILQRFCPKSKWNAAPSSGSPPRLRVVMTWQFDVSDIDLHTHGNGETSYYGNPGIADGALRFDDTNGFGPEEFYFFDDSVKLTDAAATLSNTFGVKVKYFATGSQGYGVGGVQFIAFNEETGQLGVYDRPFVLEDDHSDTEAAVASFDHVEFNKTITWKCDLE